ncbi:MAG: exodeoxyribonuclease VII large subunit [Candidatus Eisenbacteria sp.]|nr:exodeoxyribonuclease VII large subunit [Candidatus Eisenbacteria bacterium]
MQQRLTVSEVTSLIKHCIEDAIAPLWVEGEISNFVAHRSGHFYFSLKDAHAQLRCAMFRNANQRLRFMPEDGMQCAAFGRASVYAPSGQYQLIAERLLPIGEGELQLAFEALKQRLAAEGLFDAARKRPLPAFPETIGVVTSPTGAAIRDIVKVLRRRWPPIRIILRPSAVQGKGASQDIARGIEELCRCDAADLLIVGRGGGSLEDLWAFNEEITARAIASSSIPVISAVGHEIDTTIADLAADVRAPTPSAAAEIAVRDLPQTFADLRHSLDRAATALTRRLSEYKLKLEALGRSRGMQSPVDRLLQEGQHADELLLRGQRAVTQRLVATQDRLTALGARIEALNPTAVLERGFALAFDSAGRLLHAAGDVADGDEVRLQLGRGALLCRVESHLLPGQDGETQPETQGTDR